MIKEKQKEMELKTKSVKLILNEYRLAKEKLLEAERLVDKDIVSRAEAKIDFINWLLIKK